MKILWILFIGSMLITSIANAADFRIFRSDPQALIISLTGDIKKDDPQNLKIILDSNPLAKEKFLVLNSIGGEVTAGMEMAQLILNSSVHTIIPVKGRCLGACSQVFVAGWDDIRLTPVRYRHFQRLLGIPLTQNERLKSAPINVMKAVRTYFEFMETCKAHYRLTVSITPQKMKLVRNIKYKAKGDHKVVVLSKTKKTSRASKKRPRKSYVSKRRQLEKWRRSFLENSD